jgi:Uma2 family endonuclease
MAGASRRHNLITHNFNRTIGAQLVDRPCEVYSNEMRVRVPTGLYTYPDIVIACDPQFEDAEIDTLTNPIVIIEVLSDSTQDYDRGTKLKHYREIESLREYVVVEQSSARIEHFVLEDNQWRLRDVIGMDQHLRLDSIACEIPFKEIYRKVTFETSPPPEKQE